LYPVAVYGCYFTYIQSHKGLLFFYLPILILAICDPLAALAGKRYPFGKYKIGMAKKTISGSLAFFLSSFLVTVCCFWFNTTPDFKLAAILPATFLITTTATAVEAISAQGSDNIFIPSVVVLNLTLIL
jgi:phytol kinase